MSDNKFPWNKPDKPAEDVEAFITNFRKNMHPNQIELLEHLKDNIFGLKYDSISGVRGGPTEAVFTFEHLGVKGSIKISF